ncbi:MAG: hypothetical protein J6X55_16415 [Victivallales bacterium]|nr:hypothetical protein [Victivallales bacterium]
MIQITNFRQGAILNHNHGKETPDGLDIVLQGISNGGYPVKVNGIPAIMDGAIFNAPLTLTQKINEITASVLTPYGTFSQSLMLVWDKQSFKRCNFFIDDHSFTFTELSKQRPKHAFDHFYLAHLKKLNKLYGLKVTLNTFFHDDHHDCDLTAMPDIWKNEFIDNSDWLKFSFHAYSEFPDRPYAEADAETFGHDWDITQQEIVRFAGEESFIAPVVIHWANIHPAVAQEAIRRGMTCYHGPMRLRVTGGPSLASRMKGGNMNETEQRSMSGEDRAASTEGLRLHYGFQDEGSYFNKHTAFYDPTLGICFFSSTVCCNLVPLANIAPRYQDAMRINDENGVEILGSVSHEQYSFPTYSNYLPDHLDRLESAIKTMTEGGYKPVFFSNGLLGNTAWD